MYTDQSDFLYHIASWRNPWLDQFFLFLDYFDSKYFLMALIPFTWIAISPRWGLRIAVLLIFNALINYHAKALFDLSRPIIDFPSLAMLPYRTPGFPSGAAQMTILLGGLLIYAWKSRWAYAIAIPYILLISFSRLYLGVHYPIDILGGWIIGIALLFGYINCIKAIEKFLAKQGRGFSILLCVILCFLYAFLLAGPSRLSLMGAMIGFGTGTYISLQYHIYSEQHRAISKRIFSGFLAIISVFFISLVMPPTTPGSLQAFIIALWISLGATPFCRALIRQ